MEPTYHEEVHRGKGDQQHHMRISSPDRMSHQSTVQNTQQQQRARSLLLGMVPETRQGSEAILLSEFVITLILVMGTLLYLDSNHLKSFLQQHLHAYVSASHEY